MLEEAVVTPASETDDSWVNLSEIRAGMQKDTPAAPPKEEAKTAPVPEAGKPEEEEEEAGKDEKPKGGFQRRIDKLTKEKAELQRQYESEVGDLRARLDALEKPKAEIKAEAKAEGDPEPSEENFKDYKEYAKALARWTTRQELKAEKESAKKADEDSARKESDARAKASLDSFLGDIRQARETDQDFEKAIQTGLEIPNWMDFECKRRGSVGAKIIVALAKNRTAYDEIVALNNEAVERGDNDFTEAFDAFSAFVRSLKNSSPEKKGKPVSQAPEPIKPVAGSAGTTGHNTENEEYISLSDLRKRANR